jgi:hypothetical protein
MTRLCALSEHQERSIGMNTDMNTRAGYGWEQVPRHSDWAAVDEGLRQHMLRVYNYVALGLALTGPFLISFSPGIPFPGSQINSKGCGSFFFRRNQFGFLSGAAMGATKQNEQPMTA